MASALIPALRITAAGPPARASPCCATSCAASATPTRSHPRDDGRHRAGRQRGRDERRRARLRPARGDDDRRGARRGRAACTSSSATTVAGSRRRPTRRSSGTAWRSWSTSRRRWRSSAARPGTDVTMIFDLRGRAPDPRRSRRDVVIEAAELELTVQVSAGRGITRLPILRRAVAGTSAKAGLPVDRIDDALLILEALLADSEIASAERGPPRPHRPARQLRAAHGSARRDARPSACSRPRAADRRPGDRAPRDERPDRRRRQPPAHRRRRPVARAITRPRGAAARPRRPRGRLERAPVAVGEALQRALPRALADGLQRAARQALALQRLSRKLAHDGGQGARVCRAQATCDAVGDDARRPAFADGHDRQPARLRFEQDLAERVRAAGEEEDVRARVGARQRVALEPAEERRVLAEALAQGVLLRARRRRARGAAAGRARAAARNASASRSAPFSFVSRPA